MEKDINFAERILTISNKDNFKTKSGKMKYMPLSDNLHSLFLEMQGRNENNILSLNNLNLDNYVFANPQGYKYYVSMEFREILRKLNFKEICHFHCLRHTFITQLIKNGVNINYIKEIAEHSEIQTTINYIHISINDLRETLNKINYR